MPTRPAGRCFAVASQVRRERWEQGLAQGWIERKMSPAYDPAKEVGGSWYACSKPVTMFVGGRRAVLHEGVKKLLQVLATSAEIATRIYWTRYSPSRVLIEDWREKSHDLLFWSRLCRSISVAAVAAAAPFW